MSCVLRVSGKKELVRKYQDIHLLKNIHTYIKGSPVNPDKPDGKKYQFSGIGLTVSSKDWDDLNGQIKETIAFLEKNQAGLRQLVRFGFKDIRLDFGIWKRDSWAQYDYFPPRLIQAAAKFGIGIELSQYQGEAEKPVKRKIKRG